MSNIRLAIVGCGGAARHHYLPALKRIGWRPVCYVDEKLDAAQAFALGSSASAAADLESVINEFDAAIVTSKRVGRPNLCCELADAGKHLLVGLPVSLTPEEANSVFGQARATIFASSHLRFAKAALWIKFLLADQQLGRIIGIDVRAGRPFTGHGETAAIWSGEEWGGVFAERGAELVDLLSWWQGPLSVHSFADDGLGGAEAEALVSLCTSLGVRGTVELSRSRSLRNSIMIRGEAGWVDFDLTHFRLRAEPRSILERRYNNLSGRFSFDRSERHIYVQQLKGWRSAIGSGRHDANDKTEALQTTSLLHECRQRRQPLKQTWLTPTSRAATGAPQTRSALQGRRVLVTGASGFIGTRLVERLVLEHGAKVTALVRKPSRAARLARLNVQIRQADLNNSSELDRVVTEQDVVLNLAYDFKRSASENVIAFENLANASTTHSVGRFVQVSSIVVYDDWPHGNLTETSPMERSGSDYKNAKMEMERALFDQTGRAALASAIVQPTIVYGPYSWLWTDQVVDQLASGTVILPGEGRGLCPAVYVDDVADAIILAAVAEGAGGKRFIVSGDEPVTWRTFHEAYERALNVNSLEYVDGAALSGDHEGGGKLKSLIANPLQLATWAPVRNVLNKIEQTMGEGAIEKLRAQVVALRSRGRRPIYYPNAGNLTLFQSKGHCSIEKASKELGYDPAFDFTEGSKLTADYIRWRYASRAGGNENKG